MLNVGNGSAADLKIAFSMTSIALFPTIGRTYHEGNDLMNHRWRILRNRGGDGEKRGYESM